MTYWFFRALIRFVTFLFAVWPIYMYFYGPEDSVIALEYLWTTILYIYTSINEHGLIGAIIQNLSEHTFETLKKHGVLGTIFQNLLNALLSKETQTYWLPRIDSWRYATGAIIKDIIDSSYVWAWNYYENMDPMLSNKIFLTILDWGCTCSDFSDAILYPIIYLTDTTFKVFSQLSGRIGGAIMPTLEYYAARYTLAWIIYVVVIGISCVPANAIEHLLAMLDYYTFEWAIPLLCDLLRFLKLSCEYALYIVFGIEWRDPKETYQEWFTLWRKPGRDHIAPALEKIRWWRNPASWWQREIRKLKSLYEQSRSDSPWVRFRVKVELHELRKSYREWMETKNYELYTQQCPQVLIFIISFVAPALGMLLGLAHRVTSIIDHASKHKKVTLAVIILCLMIYHVYPAKLIVLIIFYRCMLSHFLLTDPNMWNYVVGPRNCTDCTEEERRRAMDYYKKQHLIFVIIQFLLAVCFYYI